MFDFSGAKTEKEKIDLLVIACTVTYVQQRVFSISKRRITTHAINIQYSTYKDAAGVEQYKLEYLTVNQHYLFIHQDVAQLLDSTFLKLTLNVTGQVVKDVFADFKTTSGVNYYNFDDFIAIDCLPSSITRSVEPNRVITVFKTLVDAKLYQTSMISVNNGKLSKIFVPSGPPTLTELQSYHK